MKQWQLIPEKLSHRVEKRGKSQSKPKAYVAAASSGRNHEQTKTLFKFVIEVVHM
jgi:hypothetical protein